MSTRDPAFALIPMKRFAAAKSRLAEQLGPAQRYACARDMFERVLRAALGCNSVARTVVLTNGEDVAEAAAALGASVLWDAPLPVSAPMPGPAVDPKSLLPSPRASALQPAARPLGSLIDVALAGLPDLDARAVVVLMADLPLLTSADVAELLAALDAHDLALIPDARGPCTNALAARLPLAIPTAFGHAASYAEHMARAQTAALRVCELRNARVACDVDTLDDLPSELAALYGAPR